MISLIPSRKENSVTYGYEEKWLALKRELERRTDNADDIISALKDYYEIFDEKTLAWLASLYDSKEGGFYYSVSGRDNDTVTFHTGDVYKLLPDIESTGQALTLLTKALVIKERSEIPEVMKRQIEKFVVSRQDKETGFFYHPQWPKEFTNTSPQRLGRDQSQAVGLAEDLEFKLPYLTADERLEKKLSGEEVECDTLPEFLLSKNKFLDYLQSLDWVNNAYYSGNLMASLASCINAAGMTDVAVEYLNSIQDKETGLWGVLGGYASINAYLKITGFYCDVNRPIPNADKAAKAVLRCATTDEEPQTVCWQYNVWFSLYNIARNLLSTGSEEERKLVDVILRDILAEAPSAIRATKEKVLKFRKSDYSFSYMPNMTACNSQNMPVAIPGTNEGDVNATIICTSGILENIFNAMGIGEFMIPIYAPDAKEKFFSYLNL